MVTGDLLSRARAGDGEAFRELTRSHRREGLFREPADHGNRWRNPVAVGAFHA